LIFNLRVLDVLANLGYMNDERLNDAAEILLQKRYKDGTWILEITSAERTEANIEEKGNLANG